MELPPRASNLDVKYVRNRIIFRGVMVLQRGAEIKKQHVCKKYYETKCCKRVRRYHYSLPFRTKRQNNRENMRALKLPQKGISMCYSSVSSILT